MAEEPADAETVRQLKLGLKHWEAALKSVKEGRCFDMQTEIGYVRVHLSGAETAAQNAGWLAIAGENLGNTFVIDSTKELAWEAAHEAHSRVRTSD